MLFLKTMIIQQKVKFEYGYKFNEKRMQRQKILLPVTDEDSPDWQFMEEYMRRKEILLLKPTIEKLCKLLIHREKLGGKLCHSQWKPFSFTEVFTKIQRGKRLKKQTTLKVQSRMFHLRHSTMEWMDSLVMKTA